MKLVVIWSNGDKEKVEVSDKYVENFKKDRPHLKAGWLMTFMQDEVEIGMLNMSHARKVYLED